MVAVKKKPLIVWVGVELQPDMQKPERPIRLGVVLVETTPAGQNNFVIMGREPILESRPPELRNAGELTMGLAAGWVDNMMKDLVEVREGDPLGFLTARWRWNLYVIKPTRVAGAAEHPSVQGLLTIARKKYEKFVGQPFNTRVQPMPVRQAPDRVTIPPAWMTEAITRQRSGGVSPL
jgi:hypothetical protein